MLLALSTFFWATFAGIETSLFRMLLILIGFSVMLTYAVLRFFYAVEQQTYARITEYLDTLPVRQTSGMLPDGLARDFYRRGHDGPKRWWALRMEVLTLPGSMAAYYRQRLRWRPRS